MTEAVANVICRENGGIRVSSFNSLPLEQASLTYSIYQQHFNCSGSEESLCDCEITSQTCASKALARLKCFYPGNYSRKIYS